VPGSTRRTAGAVSLAGHDPQGVYPGRDRTLPYLQADAALLCHPESGAVAVYAAHRGMAWLRVFSADHLAARGQAGRHVGRDCVADCAAAGLEAAY
ncbi:MAG: hypothetical protein JW963_18065, partial [Anaerolineales bacterium]|nr:hypothetical protein [Anaerolineales bacterium]